MRQISGNKLLVKALKEEGVTTLFGYPGACTIDISDELYRQSGIDIILPRHEQALVHEADAYARTTGKVGVCLVTSGPGATNLVRKWTLSALHVVLQNTVLLSATVKISAASLKRPFISQEPAAQVLS